MGERFHGKTAVISGGSRGMGLAAAKLLAKEGASVAILSLDDVKLAADEVRQEAGHDKVISLMTDVTQSQQVQAAIHQIADRFGGIDILVNCAGVQRYGSVVDTDEAVWDEVMNTNLKSVFLTSKYCIPEMQKRGGGSIVNISSVQAYASQKQVAAYTASKGGINALTRAMALDHAKDQIRVNCVCPASIDTPMLRRSADLFKGEASQEDTIRLWGRSHPLGRVGTPQDVAELIAFLCSDQAGFITGGDYKIDGGLMSALGVTLPE